MKVSEFLRQYQLTGQVPTPDDAMVSYWAGWLIGHSNRHNKVTMTLEQEISRALQAAEFIEEHANVVR